MTACKASQNINLPQLQNLIKRDPDSYRDEVCACLFTTCFWSVPITHVGTGHLSIWQSLNASHDSSKYNNHSLALSESVNARITYTYKSTHLKVSDTCCWKSRPCTCYK